MNASLEFTAIQAIFHRQLNLNRAIRYVIDHAGVDAGAAEQALRQVMTSYKQ